MAVSRATHRAVRGFFAFACALVAASTTHAVSAATTSPTTIPAGTRLFFHVTEPISSNQSKTGAPFQFVMLQPVVENGQVVVAQGATGDGTIYLAGHAGSSGHEGDVTLRLDSAPTVDGRVVIFADQRLEINGGNRKVASSLLGFVPYVGLAAGFIRGSDIHIGVDRPITTVLSRPATIGGPPAIEPAPAAPAGTASAAPSETPSPSP